MEGLDKWKSGGFSDMERENVAANEYLSKKVQEPSFAFEGSFLFTRQTPLRNIECTATGSHKVLTNVIKY